MAPEQNFRALCEVTPRSTWGTLAFPVQSTFCRKLPQSCSHGYKATSQQPMCLLFEYLHTCVSGPMLYDKHEDVYIFSVAEMRKWALKDRQNPHAARLGSLLPGVVPSPTQAFFSLLAWLSTPMLVPSSQQLPSTHAPSHPPPRVPGRRDRLQANGRVRILIRCTGDFLPFLVPTFTSKDISTESPASPGQEAEHPIPKLASGVPAQCIAQGRLESNQFGEWPRMDCSPVSIYPGLVRCKLR